MMRFSFFLILFSLGFLCFSQNEQEREHRIKKSQFPSEAVDFFTENIKEVKKIRYYKEVDTAQTTYSVKFKKDRLNYHIVFDKKNTLQTIGFRVKEIDLPSDTYLKIESYLTGRFDTFKIRRIFQQYSISKERTENQVLKDAFQNLMLPTTTYRFLISVRENGERKKYEALFDAEGNLKNIRAALPANYDRVLY